MNFDEEKIKEISKVYLASARAGDWQHALRVVNWVKDLGKGRNDLNLLITAAYIHDIGWSGIALKRKMTLDEILELEPQANENSEKLIPEALLEFQFSEIEIKNIMRLVEAADKHEASQEDEMIIVDADDISKLCIEHLQEKYRPESFLQLVNKFKEEYPSRIKTEKGKQLYPELLLELEREVLQVLN
jgi:hypothetical protein